MYKTKVVAASGDAEADKKTLWAVFGGGKRLTTVARRNPTCASGFQMKLRTAGSGLLTAESKASVCVLPGVATENASWRAKGGAVVGDPDGVWRRWHSRIADGDFEGRAESPSVLLETAVATCASGLAVGSNLDTYDPDEAGMEKKERRAALVKEMTEGETLPGTPAKRFACVAPFGKDTTAYARKDWLAAGKPGSRPPAKSTWTEEPLSTFVAAATAADAATCVEEACPLWRWGSAGGANEKMTGSRLRCTRALDTKRAGTACKTSIYGGAWDEAIESAHKNPAILLQTRWPILLSRNTNGFVARTPAEDNPRCNLDSQGACKPGDYRVICESNPKNAPRGVQLVDRCGTHREAEAELKLALAPMSATEGVRAGATRLLARRTKADAKRTGVKSSAASSSSPASVARRAVTKRSK